MPTERRVLQFTVAGLAQPKGSTRSFVVTGRNGQPRAATTSDNPKNTGWQQTIAQTAAVALLMPEHRGCRFLEGGVYFEVVFYLPRPKALLTKSKAAQSFDHTKKPDLDKLIRSAKDALSGVVWTDDAQVVHVVARKRYCSASEFPRAVIRISSALKETA